MHFYPPEGDTLAHSYHGQRVGKAHSKGQQRHVAKGSKGTPISLTPDVSSEDWHARQGYGMELVCQGDVVCCPHVGVAQLVKCEEADWPSCVHTITPSDM